MRQRSNYVKSLSESEKNRLMKVYEKNRKIGRKNLSYKASVSEMKARTFLHWIKSGKIVCNKNDAVVLPGRSREEVRNSFDPVIRTRNGIRIGVSKLKSPMMYSEKDFRSELCGDISSNYFKQVSEEEEFLPFQVWIPGTKIHWCTPDDVEWAEKNITGARRINLD